MVCLTIIIPCDFFKRAQKVTLLLSHFVAKNLQKLPNLVTLHGNLNETGEICQL